jgi:hypothetical protein
MGFDSERIERIIGAVGADAPDSFMVKVMLWDRTCRFRALVEETARAMIQIKAGWPSRREAIDGMIETCLGALFCVEDFDRRSVTDNEMWLEAANWTFQIGQQRLSERLKVDASAVAS